MTTKFLSLDQYLRLESNDQTKSRVSLSLSLSENKKTKWEISAVLKGAKTTTMTPLAALFAPFW